MFSKIILLLLVGVATCFLIHRNDTCFYKGKYYGQDDTWIDNCQYKCTCKQAALGFYSCRKLCVIWDLPSLCTFNEPKPGKCCKTPQCLSWRPILYPEWYKEE